MRQLSAGRLTRPPKLRERLPHVTNSDLRPGGPDRRLPAAVLGNGSLLATVSARGAVERLFWPHVDRGQQLGELRLGLFAEGRAVWLDDEWLVHDQAYVPDASVLETRVRGEGVDLSVQDLVLPAAPVLVRRVRGDGELRLLVYCRPDFEEARHGHAAYVDPRTGALVLYRRDRVLALGVSPAGEATCGRSRRDEDYSAWDDLQDGSLVGHTVAHRATAGGLAATGSDEVTLACAFGSTPDEAVARMREALARGFDDALAERVAYDAERVAAARPAEAAAGLYRRSLLVMDTLADRQTGAVIAAPEMDPTFESSGGYGFVWGRDLAYTTLALLAAGRGDEAAGALRWLARVQAPEGLWLQRYCSDGLLGPSWGLHQIDETGAILFAYEAAYAELADHALDRELWPSARRAAEFLASFLDPVSGLPLPSVDLWEQDDGEHSYSAAAVSAGLRAAARMARRHDPAASRRYEQTGARVAAAIDEHLWSDEHGRYLRSRWVARREGPAALPEQFARKLPYPNRTAWGAVDRDERVDVSLLGLAWPFGVVDPASPRMRATVAAIERELITGSGGVRRYAGDQYAGGNAWVLATLWLGLHYRQIGDDDGFRRSVEWAERAQTPLGLLPEQVAEDGSPAWVVPLGWSHAMLVLAARPELAAVARPTHPAELVA
jgi:glucoamylase